jgi:hypothetical protein
VVTPITQPAADIAHARPNLSLAPPALRAARFEDYDRVITLQTRSGLDENRAYPDGERLWTENPAYLKHRCWWPIGWVLEDSAKDIVGYLGNLPLHYWFRGRRLLVSSGRAWVVDARYRGYAMRLLNEYYSQNNVDLLINPTVHRDAVGGHAAFESVPVPAGAWDETMFWVTNYRKCGWAYLSRYGRFLSRICSYPAAAGLWVLDSLRTQHVPHGHIDICESFDERFDLFWEKYQNRFSDHLLAERSREVLNWHFRRALENARLWIACTTEAGAITSYALFLAGEIPSLGLKRVRLVDFCSLLDGDTPLFFLAWARERCSESHIDLLEYIGYPKPLSQYASLAPRSRTLANWMYYYKAQDEELRIALQDPDVWLPSYYDGDATV